ncbi:BTAD domain-containing putative transcriptional regulator [Microbispora sp. NPDC049125]|uniref:AfsR/SARP family transcriptional regulator n=1 Tax=Microbispora sp. NPDC049125 TaxID=3154929 RepID=UPI0034660B85
MGTQVEFNILGPLEVLVGGEPLGIGGARQRAVLITLALNAGTVVPVNTLIEVVWDHDAPATARSQIATCVFGLRRAFADALGEDDLIVTRHPGYLLRPDRVVLDLQTARERRAEARDAVARGDRAKAARLLRSARDLWRGPSLAGIENARLHSQAIRLDELRCAVLEEWLALEIELANDQAVLDELLMQVAENPLRERLRGLLMLALYRLGRRAEALDNFQEARRLLVDELGLEPGPELRSLHEAILQDAPTLWPQEEAPPAPEPPPEPEPANVAFPLAQLPPDVYAFTGRSDELALLDETLLEGRSEVPRIALITGTAGVGKSGLAIHWAHRAAARFPDGQIFADLRGYDEHHGPVPPHAALDRFLRLLGVPGKQVPETLDDRSALYRSVLSNRTVLILLDNVRTAEQVIPLLPGSGRCCVLATSRACLDGIVAGYGAQQLPLNVLAKEEAAELMGKLAGSQIAADPEGATLLGTLCDRLPLALRIAAGRLASRPHWTVQTIAARLQNQQRRLDELSVGEVGIRASFRLSYQSLSPEAARLYRRLGMLDAPDFAFWVAAALAGEGNAEDLIEQLVDAQLLEVGGRDAAGQIRYRLHDLLRLYARERSQTDETEADRQLALTEVFGCLVALAEAAHRSEYAGDYSLIHGDFPRHHLGEETTARLLAAPLKWLAAERFFIVAAVKQAASMGLDEFCWDLALTSITLFETGDYFDSWRTVSHCALTAVIEAGNERGRGAMMYALGSMEVFLHAYEEAVPYFEAALELFEATGERHGYALALRNNALVDRMHGQLLSALSRYERARDILHECGDQSAEAHVLGSMALVYLDLGRTAEAADRLKQAIAISKAIGSRRGEALALYRLGELLLAQEAFEQACGAFERVLDLLRDSKDTSGRSHALRGLGEVKFRLGRYADAEEDLRMALETAKRAADRFCEARACLSLGFLHRGMDDRAAAGEFFARSHELFSAMGALTWVKRVEDAACTPDPYVAVD